MDTPRYERSPGDNDPDSPYAQQRPDHQEGHQPGYQNGYQQGPGPGSAQGESHKRNSIIMGVIGLFLLGIVLGPLAIWQASKAETLGVKATAGKVLGWIDLVFGVLGLFVVFGGGGMPV
ncbi:hypothetical protein [Kocuria aegyptia]|uniref:DUF4190 domain-containing protein n=1 Tax=Kocuria aegyptia TaxID=330943 RepID=A0ABP4WZ89_9MICC